MLIKITVLASILMSGADSHVAGLGNMAEELAPNQKGQTGYEGYLNERVAALPELLRDAGYKTYMTGKWHLGKEMSNSPAARGFDRSYALLEGDAGHFNSLPVVGIDTPPGSSTLESMLHHIAQLGLLILLSINSFRAIKSSGWTAASFTSKSFTTSFNFSRPINGFPSVVAT